MTLLLSTFLNSVESKNIITILNNTLNDYDHIDLRYVNNLIGLNNAQKYYKIARITDPFNLLVNGQINIDASSNYFSKMTFHSRIVEYNSESDYKWRGTTLKDGNSIMLIKKSYGIAGALYISDENKRYHIIPLINNDVVIIPSNPSVITGCEMHGLTDEDPPTSNFAECESNCPGTVDILFILDPESFGFLGQSPHRHIDKMVAELEEVWQNSEVDNSVNYKVHIVDDPLFPVLNPDLPELRNCAEIIDAISMDQEIQNLRNSYNADLVVYLPLYQFTFLLACAANFGPIDETSYLAIPIENSLDNLIFPHEIGHLFGGRHQLISGNEGTDCARAWNIRDSSNELYPTTLGAPLISNDRIPYYSDPDISWMGYPTGDWDALDITNSAVNAGKMKTTGCIISEFRQANEIYSNIILEEQGCQLNLTAQVDPFDPNYDYTWRWSYDGYFDGVSPGVALGIGGNLTVDEPVLDKCRFYFIQLEVSLNGTLISSSTISQQGGNCIYTPIPCADVGLLTLQDNQEKLTAVENEIVSSNNEKNLQVRIYDIMGRLIFKGTDEENVLGKLANKRGIFILSKQDRKGNIYTRKILSHDQ